MLKRDAALAPLSEQQMMLGEHIEHRRRLGRGVELSAFKQLDSDAVYRGSGGIFSKCPSIRGPLDSQFAHHRQAPPPRRGEGRGGLLRRRHRPLLLRRSGRENGAKDCPEVACRLAPTTPEEGRRRRRFRKPATAPQTATAAQSFRFLLAPRW